MKFLRLFPVVLIWAFSCESEEKTYPAEPFIHDASITFNPSINLFDTIKLRFFFRDGDLDLGFSLTMPEHFSTPYHDANFYVIDNNNLVKFPSKRAAGYYMSLDAPPTQQGKIATYSRMKKLGLVNEFSCESFPDLYMALESSLGHLIDQTDNFDVFFYEGKKYFEVRDSLLIEPNENHYNIFVDFLVEQQDGTFAVYEWPLDFMCNQINMDGRTPYLEGRWPSRLVEQGPFKLRRISDFSGELTYSMLMLSAPSFFGGKKIKVRVSIKDRALNHSNEIETEAILIPQ